MITATPSPVFQARVLPWLLVCFGAAISNDKKERNHRFFEEASETVQSLGMTSSEAHQLVDYTWGRPVGEPLQEVGGVMVTLAALCLASGIDMHEAGEAELSRIWTMVEKIRAKQAAKPAHSPLPEAAHGADLQGLREALLEKPHPGQRDADGWLSHPAIPFMDEDVRYDQFLAVFGIETAFIAMESQCNDEALVESAFGGGSCLAWIPDDPPGGGWRLTEIYGTEDGPYALFVRAAALPPREIRRAS